MDTLISGFAEDYRRQFINSDSNNDQLEHSLVFPSGSFTNKLSKFTLATFDDEGNETILQEEIFICQFIYFSKSFQVDVSVKWVRGLFDKYIVIVHFVMPIYSLMIQNGVRFL